MTKLFNAFKKPCFWIIFGPFSQLENIFPENVDLPCTFSYRFLAPCQNLEKINDTIPRKRLDRQKDRQKDGRNNRLYASLPAITGDPKNILVSEIFSNRYIMVY